MALSSDFPNDSILARRGGTVSLAPILDLARYAIDRGIHQESVESFLGIPLKNADPNSKISSIAGPVIFNQILVDGVSDSPAIELAQSAPLGFLGGLERLVFLAPTGREALRAMASNFAVFHDALIAEFDETVAYAKFSFRYDGVEYDNGCCNELVVSFLVRLMRFVFGVHGQPHEVQFRYDRNGKATAYENYFSVPLKFWSEDESFSIIFKKDNMDWKQPGHDPELFRIAVERISRTAALKRESLPAVDYFALINASNDCVRAGIFNVAAVATKAGFGERTAQRIAHRHGSSIGKLIDQARLRMLRQQLARSPHTCAEDLSMMVGFSESRALRRAVKAWTGQSLSKLREDHTDHNNLS